MKKTLSVLLAAAVLCLCAFASAGDVLYPVYSLDMATFDQAGEVSISAGLSSSAVDAEKGTVILDVYGFDRYPVEAVRALQPGDVLFVNNAEMTVETLKWDGDDYLDINDGYFDADGASLCEWYEPDGYMYSMLYNDRICQTMLGQAEYPLADTVTFISFHWTEDGEPDDELDIVQLAPAEVKAYMEQLEEKGTDFWYGDTTVRLENGKVVEVRVDWSPDA